MQDVSGLCCVVHYFWQIVKVFPAVVTFLAPQQIVFTLTCSFVFMRIIRCMIRTESEFIYYACQDPWILILFSTARPIIQMILFSYLWCVVVCSDFKYLWWLIHVGMSSWVGGLYLYVSDNGYLLPWSRLNMFDLVTVQI